MSTFLYSLGRTAYRRRTAVLLVWLVALVAVSALAVTLQKGFKDDFTLPGTESQSALDALQRTFPQVSGTSAQLIVVMPEGVGVRSVAVREAIRESVERLDKVSQVSQATSPFDQYAKGVISPDSSAAIITVGFDVAAADITDATFASLEAETSRLQDQLSGSQASIGGDAYSSGATGVSATEAVSLLVAFLVLLITLGSLRAAGMPLLTALLGVAITVAMILAATGVVAVTSTTPALALMLGLAVGIDYALFITSRHRDQLREGLDPEESTARAVATSGSAVVFAGMTVVIALCGLAVAGIPFLTTMGLAAAGGVAVAVLIALTLLPALLGFAGDRLRPRERNRRPRALPRRSAEGKRRKPRVGLARRWVRLVTKVPIVTVLIVVAGLGAVAWPAHDLRLSLPTNGTTAPGTAARVTYDLVSEHFGPGYNGQLIVAAPLVASPDPLGVMAGIADELRNLPGVASVPLATPNAKADTGIVQVVPTGAPDSEETKALVREIRALKPHFLAEYGVPVSVTGVAAVGIDVSDRLGAALVPFGILVVGLSLVLLAMVFRSVAVPVKAAVGFLLSLGAAFGASTAVFQWGWFNGALNVAQTGPMVSFLPILMMGILFGLAMDYEVFLVSRIREEYVNAVQRSGSASRSDAHQAIEEGFAASARVVIGAAVIMFAVFAAFVPEGEGAIKTIGFGLAVGIFVDAFVVRMTLVPAVLALLGRSAWWLPRWLDRLLPSFDVEGQGMTHLISLTDWPEPNSPYVIAASDLRINDRQGSPVTTGSLFLTAGQIGVVESGAPAVGTAFLLALVGRLKITGGHVKVTDLVLPEQAGRLRRRASYVDAADHDGLLSALAGASRSQVVVVDHADQTDPAGTEALGRFLSHAKQAGLTVVLATADATVVAPHLPAGSPLVTLPVHPSAMPVAASTGRSLDLVGRSAAGSAGPR